MSKPRFHTCPATSHAGRTATSHHDLIFMGIRARSAGFRDVRSPRAPCDSQNERHSPDAYGINSGQKVNSPLSRSAAVFRMKNLKTHSFRFRPRQFHTHEFRDSPSKPPSELEASRDLRVALSAVMHASMADKLNADNDQFAGGFVSDEPRSPAGACVGRLTDIAKSDRPNSQPLSGRSA